MVTSYDDKGKIFTQVISKHPVPVVIQTQSHFIRGTIHVRVNHRVKDEVNGDERFIAVTNAVVYNNDKAELYQAPLMIVNTDHIVWLVPDEQ